MKPCRFISLFTALVAIFVVAASFYIEKVLGVEACDLCLLQRALFALIAVSGVLAFFQHNNLKRVKLYSLLSYLFSLGGLALAGRQLWLQHQPMSVTHNCLPGFSYMVHNMDATKALELFKGKTSCSEFVWSFQGISLAGWAMIIFAIIAALTLKQLIGAKYCKKK